MKKSSRMVRMIVAIILVSAFLMPTQAMAVSYDTKTSAQKKVNKSIKNHKSSLTLYTKKNLDPYTIFLKPATSRGKKGVIVAEKRSYQGDYNFHSYLYDWDVVQWRINKGNKKYYKYKFKFKYSISKKKTRYIDRRCKAVGKKYRKGSVRKRTEGICMWIARNMDYKVVHYPTIYQSLKNKKGKCTHYSLMFYKIAKEAGLNVRLVVGKARSHPLDKYEWHAWCIVKAGKKWYQVDPTWADDGKTIDKTWIMKGKSDLYFSLTHKPAKKYRTLMKKTCPLAK